MRKLPLLPLWEKGEGGMLASVEFSGAPSCCIARFRHQDAQTPPSPLVGEGGREEEGKKASERGQRFASRKLYVCQVPERSANLWYNSAFIQFAANCECKEESL